MVSAGQGVTLTSNMQADFLLIWNDLLAKLADAPKTWMLRDFHSPNLIWLAQRDASSASACWIFRTR
jgi:aminoglycoside/choline kinase family phosphotransferase